MALKEFLGLPMNVVLSLLQWLLQRVFPTCSSSLWSNRIFPNAHQGFPTGEEARKNCTFPWPQLHSTEKEGAPKYSVLVMNHLYLKVCRKTNSVRSAHTPMFWDMCAVPYEKEAGEFSWSLNYGPSYKYCYIIFSPVSSFHLGRNLGEIHRAEGG